MKPSANTEYVFQTNKKPKTGETLLNVESNSRRPWGYSDEKHSPGQHINVDLLSNLATNIQKFQIKRRVKRSSQSIRKRKVEMEEGTELVVSGQYQKENFQSLIKDFKKRIQMLGTHDHKRKTPEQPSHIIQFATQPQLDNTLTTVLTARNAHNMKSIALKFGQIQRHKPLKVCSARDSTQLSLNPTSQIRTRILSKRRQTLPIGTRNKSRQQTARSTDIFHTRRSSDCRLPVNSINKSIQAEIKERPRQQMKIFDIEELRKLGVLGSWKESQEVQNSLSSPTYVCHKYQRKNNRSTKESIQMVLLR